MKCLLDLTMPRIITRIKHVNTGASQWCQDPFILLQLLRMPRAFVLRGFYPLTFNVLEIKTKKLNYIKNNEHIKC